MKTNYLKLSSLIGIFSFALNVLAVPLAGTYTVGAGETYTSPQAALTAVRNEGISANVTFNVKSGTYSANISYNSANLTSGFTVTMQSLTGNKNDVELRNASTSQALYLSNLKGLTFKDLTIKQYNARYLIRLAGNLQDVEFQNCNLIGFTTTSTSTTYSIIYNTSSGNKNISFVGCSFDQGSRAFYYYGRTENLTIQNCVFQNHYYGMYLQSVTNLKLTNNSMTNVRSEALNISSSFNIEIANNKMNTTNGSAFYLNNNRINGSGKNLISNNEFRCQGNYALYLNGDNDGLEFYFNSFIASSNYAVYLRNSQKDLKFKNNLMYSASNCSQIIRVRDSRGFTNAEISNNAYGSPNPNCLYLNIDNITYSTISEARSRTIFGTNSVMGSPDFVNYPTNLSPQNGLFGNIGIPITGITKDLNNVNRNSSQPDAGAYEFNPTKSNDLAVLSINGFKSPNCVNNKDISVTVKNIGLNSIDSFAIRYWVNGNEIGTKYIVNSLAQAASTNVNLGAYNFDGDNDSIMVTLITVEGAADSDPSNNTQSINGLYAPVVGGTYTFGENDTLKGMKEFVEKMSNGGVCGPVVIKIKNGTYTHEIDFSFAQIAGASSANTITIESESGNRADVVLRPSNSYNYGVFELENTKYVTLKNFTIDGNDIGEPTLYINSFCDYLTLENMVLLGDSNQNDDNISVDNFINGFTMNNCYVYGGEQGVESYGNNDAAPINITNCEFINQNEYACEFGEHKYVRIHNNRFVSKVNSAYLGYFEYNSTFIFTNNYVLADSAESQEVMYFYYNNDHNTGISNISNNYFGGFDNPNAVVYFESETPSIFANNTIVSDVNTGNNYNIEYYDYSNNTIFANNLMLNTNGGTLLYLDDNNNYPAKLDGNDYFTAGNVVNNNGTPYSTLAEWQTASNRDKNSLSADPNMNNIRDMHICNPALEGAGIIVENLGADIDGDLRNNGSPDIGADEFAKPGSGDFLVTDNASLCNGKTMLKASPGATSYLWSTGATTQSIEVTAMGTYWVEVTGLCGSNGKDSVTVDSNALQAQFVVANVFGRNVSLYNTSKGSATSYNWEFGDGSSSAQANPSHTYATYGVYTVTLTISNDCGTKTISRAISFFPVGVKQLNNTDIKIYPNPTQGRLNIQLADAFEGSSSVRILDVSGKVIFTGNLGLNQNETEIDLSNYSNGMYMVQIQLGSETANYRIIKE